MNQIQDSSLLNLSQHIAKIQKRVSELESKIELNNDKLANLAHASKERFDRMNSLLGNIEYGFKNLNKELKNELANVNSQLTQRKISDSRLTSLIEKYNETIVSHEERFSKIRNEVKKHSLEISDLASRLR